VDLAGARARDDRAGVAGPDPAAGHDARRGPAALTRAAMVAAPSSAEGRAPRGEQARGAGGHHRLEGVGQIGRQVEGRWK
jgi:hypothetical protein